MTDPKPTLKSLAAEAKAAKKANPSLEAAKKKTLAPDPVETDITSDRMDWSGTHFKGKDLTVRRKTNNPDEVGPFQYNFKSAILKGCDFTGANLEGQCLQGADLRGAIFKNANCKGTDFRWALLHDADFEDADFTDADLRESHGL